MQFVGINADDGTIFRMQGTYGEGILAAKDDVVIEFVPKISELAGVSKKKRKN